MSSVRDLAAAFNRDPVLFREQAGRVLFRAEYLLGALLRRGALAQRRPGFLLAGHARGTAFGSLKRGIRCEQVNCFNGPWSCGPWSEASPR